MGKINIPRRTRMSERRLATLATLPVHHDDPPDGIEDAYERSAFGHGWRDYDRDGEDARAEVLIAFHRPGRSKVEIVKDGDRVVSGRWRCRFSRDWYTDAGLLDIDHLVPLKAAWIAGAHAWDRDRCQRFANGQGVRSLRRGWLIPVDRSLNRSKGAKRPHEWMPPAERYHLNYAAEWIDTKSYWGLGVTAAERDALEAALLKIEV